MRWPKWHAKTVLMVPLTVLEMDANGMRAAQITVECLLMMISTPTLTVAPVEVVTLLMSQLQPQQLMPNQLNLSALSKMVKPVIVVTTPAHGTPCTQAHADPTMMMTLLPVICAAPAEEVPLWSKKMAPLKMLSKQLLSMSLNHTLKRKSKRLLKNGENTTIATDQSRTLLMHLMISVMLQNGMPT